MQQKYDIKEYIQSLISSKRLGNQVAYHAVLADHPASISKPKKPWLLVRIANGISLDFFFAQCQLEEFHMLLLHQARENTLKARDCNMNQLLSAL